MYLQNDHHKLYSKLIKKVDRFSNKNTNFAGDDRPCVIPEAVDDPRPTPEDVPGSDEATTRGRVPEARTGAHGTESASEETAGKP